MDVNVRRGSWLASAGLIVAMLLPAVAMANTVGEPIDDLPAGIGIRLLDIPVEREADPRAQFYIIDHVIPGAVVERTVLVTNGTDEALPVTMKSVPARADDGWVVESEPETPDPSSLASWISIQPSTFTLAPGTGAEVEVTIAVPGGVPPRERYAVVVAEPPPLQMGAVGSVGRVGTRVYLSVGGNEPETDFSIDTLIATRDSEGVPMIEVGVLNTGGRAIDVSGELELLSDDGVISAGPFPTAIPRTLGPRSRGSVLVPLPEELAEGPWNVTATMRSGLTERVATATVMFPTESGEQATPVEVETIGGTDEDGNDISEELRQQRRMLLPIATALLLFALVALWLLNQWRRREADERAAAEAAAAGNDVVRANE